MSKVMSAQEAISLIKDGDKIGVGGFLGIMVRTVSSRDEEFVANI